MFSSPFTIEHQRTMTCHVQYLFRISVVWSEMRIQCLTGRGPHMRPTAKFSRWKSLSCSQRQRIFGHGDSRSGSIGATNKMGDIFFRSNSKPHPYAARHLEKPKLTSVITHYRRMVATIFCSDAFQASHTSGAVWWHNHAFLYCHSGKGAETSDFLQATHDTLMLDCVEP